ncbi:MAG: CDP-glycerol glycerophosphotransferase family protein [Clostridiales bacterium]|nr:CDP-glycerol glycerophosphotransferase family protein [Candidatus Crickella caballi]
MNKALKTVIKSGIGVLSGAFAIMKLQPVKSRVVIMSRQSNRPSRDIELLRDELEARKIDTVVLCKKMDDGIRGEAAYMGELLKQMQYLASSRVIVLDSYNIPVSLFKHRSETTVIQMWHALGSMKKFGKSILDMPEGKSSEIAELMKMHAGYDIILTSSEASRSAFAEAFGYPEEKLRVVSLPRVDELLDKDKDERTAEMIKSDYPQLNTGKTIVYAPTLRVGRDMSEAVESLIEALDHERYNLVIKMHPLTEITLSEKLPENVIVDRKYQTVEMLTAADYVITDYSAITYEAALKGLPIYFYAYDRSEYIDGRSFYLDYDRDMPGPICEKAEEIARLIDDEEMTDKYVLQSKAFADKYIEKRNNCTAELADMIKELL